MTILSYPLERREPAALILEHGPTERVNIIHAKVKGRARLKVDGLYRCEPVKFRIESSLVRDAGIQRVFANVLTGRVLVVFDPSKTVDEIAVLIEGLLAAPLVPSKKPLPLSIRSVLCERSPLLTPARFLCKT